MKNYLKIMGIFGAGVIFPYAVGWAFGLAWRANAGIPHWLPVAIAYGLILVGGAIHYITSGRKNPN